MHRGRTLAVVAVALTAATVPPALAAGPLRGTIDKSWLSARQGGPPVASFPKTSPRIVANFTWLRGPTPGQRLSITFYGPDNALRAQWRTKTMRSDRAGARIWSLVQNKVFRTSPGRWKVILRVGGVARETRRFVVRR